MGRVARRLDHHARQIEVLGQRALAFERVANGVDPAEHEGKKVRLRRRIEHGNHLKSELEPEFSGLGMLRQAA